MQPKQHQLDAEERVLIETAWANFQATVSTIARLKKLAGNISLSEDRSHLIEAPTAQIAGAQMGPKNG